MQRDRGFDNHTFEKQMAVMRGQVSCTSLCVARSASVMGNMVVVLKRFSPLDCPLLRGLFQSEVPLCVMLLDAELEEGPGAEEDSL